jgi:hypothetical protein
MRKLSKAPLDLCEAVGGWTKVSEYLYVHESGARIERRGYPDPHGWYLTSPLPGEAVRWFQASAEGCDAAFVAFAGQRAVSRFLSPILRPAG